MSEFERAMAEAASRGHRLEEDPPRSRPTTTRRATCAGCQRSVLGNERRAFGSAMESECPRPTAIAIEEKPAEARFVAEPCVRVVVRGRERILAFLAWASTPPAARRASGSGYTTPNEHESFHRAEDAERIAAFLAGLP